MSTFLCYASAYDEKAGNVESHLPRLLCVITGKGPQKEKYLAQISERKWSKVEVVTPWLQAEDYPKLLGESLQIYLLTEQYGKKVIIGKMLFLHLILLLQHWVLLHSFWQYCTGRLCPTKPNLIYVLTELQKVGLTNHLWQNKKW